MLWLYSFSFLDISQILPIFLPTQLHALFLKKTPQSKKSNKTKM